jgi:acyl-CoA synthetase (AMP-forming)/AMP-acid ligase II
VPVAPQSSLQHDPSLYWSTHDEGRIAVRFGEQTWTWRQLAERVQRNAAAQFAVGLRSSDRVAFLDKNHPACLETTLACAVAGTVNSVVNFRLAPSELVFVLNDSRAHLLIVGAEFVETIRSIASELPHLRRIVVLGGDDDEYENWLSRAPAAHCTAASDPDTCFLQLYTSGTTGHPKGAMLTHRSLGAHSVSAAATFGFGHDSVNMVAMPLFHVGGSSWALAGMSQGAETIIVRNVDPDAVLNQLTTESVTHTFLVPAAIQSLLRVPGAAQRDLRKLRCLAYGGSPISADLLTAALDTFAVDFYQVYGMTEASGALCVLGPDDHRQSTWPERMTSIGRPVRGVALRVTDPATGLPVPPGQIGEFEIRGPQVMSGYWRRPELHTGLAGDWFKTGDAGYQDADGYLYIADRVKDMIITGGENVYPAEVERVIREYPGISDVAVIGVPDEKWGEAVHAVVVPADEGALAVGELLEFCASHLAGYKRPRTVQVIDVLPRNATGKVLKRDLRAPHWAGRGAKDHR